MNDFFINSSYFGFAITIVIFYICLTLKNKLKSTLLNPILISALIIIGILLIFDIKYETYNNGAKYISYFLTPTTVCLAIPLYKKIEVLKRSVIPIIVGIFSGVLANSFVVVVFSKILGISDKIGTSLLPKSITAPIAIGVVEELGGISAITVFAVILTGAVGAVIAPTICKVFKIKEEVSQGLACGTSAHAAATASALEMGEVQGAISGLAIIVTGLMTVVVAPIINGIFF